MWSTSPLVYNLFAVYNTIMNKEDRRMIAYIVACVNEFARSTGLTARDAFGYLEAHGGIDFLFEFYDTEHFLSLQDAVADLKLIAQKSGGLIA